jgi:hypothetical protein
MCAQHITCVILFNPQGPLKEKYYFHHLQTRHLRSRRSNCYASLHAVCHWESWFLCSSVSLQSGSVSQISITVTNTWEYIKRKRLILAHGFRSYSSCWFIHSFWPYKKVYFLYHSMKCNADQSHSPHGQDTIEREEETDQGSIDSPRAHQQWPKVSH